MNGSLIFDEEELNEVLDKISEEGYDNLSDREKLILDCFRTNDQVLIDYMYDYLDEYLSILEEFKEQMNEGVNNTVDLIKFMGAQDSYSEKMSEFKEKYAHKEDYLFSVLNDYEAQQLGDYMLKNYFDIEVG